jgi:hypothetical protein
MDPIPSVSCRESGTEDEPLVKASQATTLLVFFLHAYHQHHINYFRHPYSFKRDIEGNVTPVFHLFLSTVKKNA